MLLRRLINVTLKKTVIVKQENGSRLEEYEIIDDYEVSKENLDDQVSASIYGASIIKMLRIKSPLSKLENYLETKLNNTTDNISKYYFFIGENKYKIKSVGNKGIDIELVWKI